MSIDNVGIAAPIAEPAGEINFALTREQVSMANQSIKHLVDPKDIAALAVFLASDTARSISGQVLPIDGDYQRN